MKLIDAFVIVAVLVIIMLTIFLIGEEKMNAAKNETILQDGIKFGIALQVRDNIEHGVMDSEGKWIDEFRLAE